MKKFFLKKKKGIVGIKSPIIQEGQFSYYHVFRSKPAYSLEEEM